MPGIHTLQQAITALRQGSVDEAVRLIHIALEDPALQSGPLRSVAYYTLAKTTNVRDIKIGYLETAIEADAEGEAGVNAQRLLSQLLTDDLNLTLDEPFRPRETQEQKTVPPTPKMQIPTNTSSLELESMRTVGIIGTQPGTGFFISEDGYIATTRRLTRGRDKVNVEITKYGNFEGTIVYANTQIDLAIIKLNLTIINMFSVTQLSYVPENSIITAHSYRGRILQGTYRPTNRNIAGEWIPTTFTQLMDGGGNPMFNDQQQLIGMLTHNSGRSSDHLYGIHIRKILDELQWFRNSIQARPDLAYCSHCGELSRAKSLGAYYCEKCGGVLNHAREINRVPIKQSALYDEDIHRKCSRCGSQIGYHEGKCLRCGEMMY